MERAQAGGRADAGPAGGSRRCAPRSAGSARTWAARRGRDRGGTPPAGGPPLGASRPLAGVEAGSRRSRPTRDGGAQGSPGVRSLRPQPRAARPATVPRGHGGSAPPTAGRPGALAGAAAAAPERAGPGSRFPAALGPPGTCLLPAGETPAAPWRSAGAARMLRGGGGGGGAGGQEAGARDPGEAGRKSVLGSQSGSGLRHRERVHRAGQSERQELRYGPGRRGSQRRKEITQRVLHNLTGILGGRDTSAGAHGLGKETRTRGPAGEAGRGWLERGCGRSLRGSRARLGRPPAVRPADPRCALAATARAWEADPT